MTDEDKEEILALFGKMDDSIMLLQAQIDDLKISPPTSWSRQIDWLMRQNLTKAKVIGTVSAIAGCWVAWQGIIHGVPGT